jgi:microsomal dipeptidase-like Zn-dependent dipeptidase
MIPIPLLIDKLTKDGYSDEWIKEIVHGLNVVQIIEDYQN